jgi:hypothetical protein
MAEAAVGSGARWWSPDVGAPSTRSTRLEAEGHVYRRTMLNGIAQAWEYVGLLPARGFSQYSFVCPTTTDSMPGSNPLTSFMVEAEGSAFGTFWDSVPMNGYSVDNLPPPTPSPFSGSYAASATHLLWGSSPASDFSVFKLYRGSTAGFPLDVTSLIATTQETAFTDVGPAGRYYKITAVDVHGNESAYASVAPDQTTDVPEVPRLELALDGARPNPTIGGRVMIHFALPSAEAGTLELIDVGGRVLARQSVGPLGAGWHVVDLAAGLRLRSGLYFVRLRQASKTRMIRMTVVD